MLLSLMNHRNISLAKSFIRIIAGVYLININFAAGLLFIVAEVLGILEEQYENK